MEDPVEEFLHLCFSPDDSLSLRLDVLLHGYPDLDEEDADDALARRIEGMRQELLGGYGDWHDRFERLLEPLQDGVEWRRDEGHLDRYGRWARVADSGQALRDFFADLPIQASYAAAGDHRDFSELVLYPTGGDRATEGERRRVERALQELATALAAYYRATQELWSFFEANPGRIRPCLAVFFGLEEEQDEEPELEPREEALIQAIHEASKPIVDIFDVADESAFTLQELSRRVFDPFPASLRVEVPGEVMEAVGFEPQGDGFYGVPRLSFWDAWASLEGLYLDPDPLKAIVEVNLAGGDDDDFSLDDFIGQHRFFAETPASAEVHRELLRRLEPRAEYRLVRRALHEPESVPQAQGESPFDGPSERMPGKLVKLIF